MRVILDSNVIFSYLLSPPNANTTVVQIVELALDGAFSLVIPVEVIEEMENALAAKPYSKGRISAERLREVSEALGAVASELPRRTGPDIDVVRDPKDNFLLAAAVHANVDFLVSGDKDLLDLSSRLERPRIVKPADFLVLIQTPD